MCFEGGWVILLSVPAIVARLAAAVHRNNEMLRPLAVTCIVHEVGKLQEQQCC